MATAKPTAPERSPLRFAFFTWFTALVTGPTLLLLSLEVSRGGWLMLGDAEWYFFVLIPTTGLSLLPFLGFAVLTERLFRRVASPAKIRFTLSLASLAITVALASLWFESASWGGQAWWAVISCYTLPLWASIWALPFELGKGKLAIEK